MIGWKSAVLAAVLVALMPVAVSAGQPIPVIATFSILGDMVRQIGGNQVQVRVLVGPGGDAHVFQPAPADAKAVAAAGLVVVNGLGFEGWIDRLVKASGYRGPVAVASQGVSPLLMSEDEEQAQKTGQPSPRNSAKPRDVVDPHAWQSLANGRMYARNIVDALVAADPGHADGYRQRGEAYDRTLADLEVWVRGELAKVPADKRKMITSHDAFRYFSSAYGVTFMAPVGISTESEATARDVAALVRQVQRGGVKAVFLESMTDPRLAQQLARESGAVIGGTLYSDSLSDAAGPAPTYVQMFRYNVTEMVAAMLGN